MRRKVKQILYYSPIIWSNTDFYRTTGVLPFINHPELVFRDISHFGTINQWDLNGASVLIIQRPGTPKGLELLRLAKQCGVRTVVDYDDDCLNVNQLNPTYLQYEQQRPYILSCIEEADEVWVSTQAVSESFGRGIVIPNALNTELLGKCAPFNSESNKVVWRGGFCFDEETEVLTDSGFKYFKDLNGDEYIATLGENDSLEYQEIDDYFEYHYKGEMHYYKSLYVDCLVTPNHKIYSSSARHGKYELKTSESVFGEKKYFKMNCKWYGDDIEFFKMPLVKETSVILKWEIDDFLMFFGFWISDGWTWASKTGTTGQTGLALFKGDEVTNEILRILDKYNFKYTKRYKEGEFNSLTICDNNLFNYLRQFGKAHQKFIPKWILNLSKKHLTLFLKWYLKGDGCEEWVEGRSQARIRASTSSKKLVDGLVELAIKIDWAASVKNRGIRKGKYSEKVGYIINQRHESFDVSFLKNSVRNFLQTPIHGREQHKVNYDGMVYCVTVPNHVLYVRRNGKCYWSGNSHEADIYYNADFIVEMVNKHPELDFYFIGHRFTYLEQRCGSNYTSVNSMPIMQYFSYLRDLKPRAMIFPLCDNLLNRGKSNISWIEASTYGAAYFGNTMLREFNLSGTLPLIGFDNLIHNENALNTTHDLSVENIQDKLLLSKINLLRVKSLLSL